jgi:hypothetical protein
MKALIKLIALTALAAAGAQADFMISFDDPNQSGYPGQTLEFFGTIANISADPDPVYLNADTFNFAMSSASYTLVDQFFNTVPFSLDGGEQSPDIELFDVTLSIPLSDPFGSYEGTYGIFGGADGIAQENLAQIAFSVDAIPSAAPEPVSAAMLAIGLALVGWVYVGGSRSYRTNKKGTAF